MNYEEDDSKDIMKRILRWVVAVMKFVDSLPKTTVSFSVGKQLVDSAGSVGANLVEARAGRSKKEFISSVGISIKECKESLFWLTVLQEANIGNLEEDLKLFREGNEIVSILITIVKNTKLGL